MRGKSLWHRILVCGALVIAAAVGATGTASAAVTQCMTESYSDGAKTVPGTGGAQKTRSIARQQAANTWDDWVWRGPEFVCPRGRTCNYSWSKTKTTSTAWSVGGGTTLGNASSPSAKWYNALIPLVVGYERSTTITSEFTWAVDLKGGDVAVPVQIAVRRWTQGDFSGGWVRTNQGCKGGTKYEWQGNVRFGNWVRNIFVKERVSYAVNGRIL